MTPRTRALLVFGGFLAFSGLFISLTVGHSTRLTASFHRLYHAAYTSQLVNGIVPPTNPSSLGACFLPFFVLDPVGLTHYALVAMSMLGAPPAIAPSVTELLPVRSLLGFKLEATARRQWRRSTSWEPRGGAASRSKSGLGGSWGSDSAS